jgi:hypothetical protein
MHATVALLDRTRSFFNIGTSASLLFSTVSDRLNACINRRSRVVDSERTTHKPAQVSRQQLSWLATACLVPNVFTSVNEPWKEVPASIDVVQSGTPESALNELDIDGAVGRASNRLTLNPMMHQQFDQSRVQA